MDPRSRPVAALLLLAAAAAACDDGAAPPATGAAPPKAIPLDVPEDAPLVVFLGDSIAAGIHLPKDRAFPAELQRRLAAKGRPFRLVNAGVSGDTTAGGRSRLDWLLGQKPAIVVVELGANDGFRGVPAATIEGNLRDIVERVKAAGAKPLLLGMKIPPNYGLDYVVEFEGLYARLAKETGCAFVPWFMRGVAGKPELNLEDGIHPTAEGHRLLAENVEKELRRLLDSVAR
jgi:acyl-CoA thioesterase-1